MNRIFFDTNAGTSEAGYLLHFAKSLEDINEIEGGPYEGMNVIIYMPDELEMEAILRFDDEFECWRGVPVI